MIYYEVMVDDKEDPFTILVDGMKKQGEIILNGLSDFVDHLAGRHNKEDK